MKKKGEKKWKSGKNDEKTVKKKVKTCGKYHKVKKEVETNKKTVQKVKTCEKSEKM